MGTVSHEGSPLVPAPGETPPATHDTAGPRGPRPYPPAPAATAHAMNHPAPSHPACLLPLLLLACLLVLPASWFPVPPGPGQALAAEATVADTTDTSDTADKTDKADAEKQAPAAGAETASTPDQKAADGATRELAEEESREDRQAEMAAVADAEAKRREDEAQARKVAQEEEVARKAQEAADLAKNDPLRDIWLGQRGLIETDIKAAQKFASDFSADTGILDQIHDQENDIRRMMVTVNTLKQYPSPLEALSRRMGMSIDLVQAIVDTASTGMLEAEKLLIRINHTVESTTPEVAAGQNDEIREYLAGLNNARFLLTAVIARYEGALAPAKSLIASARESRAEIENCLPELWKDYYMQAPVAWLTSDEWSKLSRDLAYLGASVQLRRAVELPSTDSQWRATLIRLAMTLVVLALLAVILVRTQLRPFPGLQQDLLHRTLPWNILGLALLSSSFSVSLEPFRLIMALGNLCLIMGEIYMAWDLRKLRYPEVPVSVSPLWRLVPLTMCAYILLYLPMPTLFALIAWGGCVIANLIVHRRLFRHRPDLGPMHIERTILDTEPVILWCCLILVLLGLHIYSMVLYMLFTSVSISVQLSFGCMSLISKLNERLSREGSQSVLGSLLLALSAPVILVVAVSVVCLWLATLPGGLSMVQYYFFKSVSIGDTEFNSVQVLLIISAFFIARTTASMGSSFIGKLPEKGIRIDMSLVTPLQTAFTYFVWIAFILFVLRALGMNLSSLAVIAGGLSVGIGFGMQTIVNNFMSGLILIFSRSLQVGDVVEVGGVTGRIKKITVRCTVVETFNLATIFVPNSEFVSGRLTNWTTSNRSVRENIKVGIAYGMDTEKAVKILTDIAHREPDILAYPAPRVLLQDFGDNALQLTLQYWVRDYDLALPLSSRVRFAINKEFEAAGIEIAFPQMDVHIRRDENAGKEEGGSEGKPAPRPRRRAIARPPRPRARRIGRGGG